MPGLPIVALLGVLQCFVHALVISEPPIITPAPNLRQARAAVEDYESMNGPSTCGYEDGDPSKSWGAPAGYNCRVDTSNGLWGFCPTTVIVATDCGLGGYCFDQSSCTSGCGVLSGISSITTWTCTQSDPSSRFCQMISLSFSDDENYTYFHCGPDANRAQYYATPTSSTTSTSLSSSVDAKTSSTSPSLSATASSTPSSPTVTPTSDAASSSSTSTVQVPSSTGNQDSSNNNNNLGSIIGGVIGGLALICGSVVAVVYLLRRDKSRRQPTPSTDKPSSPDQPWSGAPHTSVQGDSTSQIGGWYPSELQDTAMKRTPSELPGMHMAADPNSPVELPVYSVR